MPFRKGRVREKIYWILKANFRPFSTKDILSWLKNSKEKCNKTTVYRALEILRKEGKVKQVVFSDGIMRYEIAGLKHHHHAVCMKCKKITDVVFSDHHRLTEQVVGRTGYRIFSHSMEFFGLCQKCSY